MSTVHVRLDEAEFRKLIGGKIVEQHFPGNVAVKIMLADIGWVNMAIAVSEAMREARVYPQPGETGDSSEADKS